MALINAECKLCDVILNEPSLIPVINRFGIILGVGDKSIRTVCEEKKLDSEFFVTILNTFINEDYFPELPAVPDSQHRAALQLAHQPERQRQQQPRTDETVFRRVEKRATLTHRT